MAAVSLGMHTPRGHAPQPRAPASSPGLRRGLARTRAAGAGGGRDGSAAPRPSAEPGLGGGGPGRLDRREEQVRRKGWGRRNGGLRASGGRSRAPVLTVHCREGVCLAVHIHGEAKEGEEVG